MTEVPRMLISTPSHCTDCTLHCCHLNVVSTILQLQICCLPSALCIYRSWPEEDKWGAGSCTRLVVSCSVGGDCLALNYLGPACARLSRQVSRYVSRGRSVTRERRIWWGYEGWDAADRSLLPALASGQAAVHRYNSLSCRHLPSL